MHLVEQWTRITHPMEEQWKSFNVVCEDLWIHFKQQQAVRNREVRELDILSSKGQPIECFSRVSDLYLQFTDTSSQELITATINERILPALIENEAIYSTIREPLTKAKIVVIAMQECTCSMVIPIP